MNNFEAKLNENRLIFGGDYPLNKKVYIFAKYA